MRTIGGGSNSRLTGRPLLAAALAAAMVMVLVSAAVIIAAQERWVRRQVEARMQATAALTNVYVLEQTTGLGALVAAYGGRLTSSDVSKVRQGDKAAAAAADTNLAGLVAARADVSVVFLTDARGALLAVHPATPVRMGTNFAFRDWYKGAVAASGPYISEAYQSAAAGKPFVIATSIALRGKPTVGSPAGSGPVFGVLGATYALSSFQRFVEGYAARTGIHLLILDQRGALIADGGHQVRPGSSGEDRRTAGRAALADHGVISAKVTNEATGWTVISEVPSAVALGEAASFRGAVLLAAGLLMLLLVAGAGATLRIRRHRRVREREVQESEDRLEAERSLARQDIDRFFSLSLDLLLIASNDGFFKLINPAWKEVLGYDPEELLGQPFVSFIHPDDLESTAAEVTKLMSGVPTVAFENRYRRKDGSYRWILWKVAPVPEKGLMYAVGRDNTERRSTEQSSARLAAIVDSSADAIVGAGLDGVVTSWNRGAQQMFGYRPDEIVGLSIRVLAPPGDGGQDDLLDRAMSGDIVVPYEVPRVRQDGQLIDVAVTTSPVRDPDGTVVGISMIARDISESRRTAAALRAIIATASDGFVSMDAGGLVTEWNHSAEAMFGWPRDEAIGRELAELIIPVAQRDAHRSGLRRVLDTVGGGSRVLDMLIEVVAVHRDGRQIPIELAVWRVSVGGVEQFSAFMRDISARQRIARDVVAARDQAVEASRLKSAFLATMSHEIRTPMNGVIGLTALLLRGDLAATERRYAEGIHVAGTALLAVINDVLDFSKIEAGALVLDEVAVDVGALLGEVVELVTQSAASKGLELLGYCDPDVPDALRGDPVRIRQILLNLASNAVKFTDHGEVVLQICRGADASAAVPGSTADPGPVKIRFEVTDTGIGIDPADGARLFDPFAQADASTTRRFGGTGLGLAICRELAEAMGGQIGFESQPGQGSTFWCELSLRSDPPVEQSPQLLDRRLKDRRVLIVDDNDTNRLILTKQMHRWAMLPTAVASGQQALDHLWDASTGGTFYDVAVVDMHMPGLDGLELARRIQTHPSLPPLPIILAGSGESLGAATAREAGIVGLLTKPIHLSQLHDYLLDVAAGGDPSSRVDSPTPSAELTPDLAPRVRVLLVEDNKINQMVAAGILGHLGYAVDVASDGLQALEMVARTTYGVVLMDCQMPRMDGYEATGELRRRERADQDQGRPGDVSVPRRMPIIAMTAAALAEDRDRCLAAGMDDYLTKPIEAEELAGVLTRWTTAAAPTAAAAPMDPRSGDPQVDWSGPGGSAEGS